MPVKHLYIHVLSTNHATFLKCRSRAIDSHPCKDIYPVFPARRDAITSLKIPYS